MQHPLEHYKHQYYIVMYLFEDLAMLCGVSISQQTNVNTQREQTQQLAIEQTK